MDRTVWKFPVNADDGAGHFEIETPPGAKPVLFGIQNNVPCVWMEISNPYEPDTETHYFCLVGTGYDVPPNATHFQSIQDGEYVWHLYVED